MGDGIGCLEWVGVCVHVCAGMCVYEHVCALTDKCTADYSLTREGGRHKSVQMSQVTGYLCIKRLAFSTEAFLNIGFDKQAYLASL